MIRKKQGDLKVQAMSSELKDPGANKLRSDKRTGHNGGASLDLIGKDEYWAVMMAREYFDEGRQDPIPGIFARRLAMVTLRTSKVGSDLVHKNESTQSRHAATATNNLTKQIRQMFSMNTSSRRFSRGCRHPGSGGRSSRPRTIQETLSCMMPSKGRVPLS